MDTEANLGLQIQRAQSRAENAEKLLRGLASQISAWTKKLDDLKRTNDRLIGDTCIAVACMVYAGPQPAEIRASLLSQWQSVVASALGCSPSETPLTACFSTEPQLRQWRIHGLPASDVHAVENAVILFGGRPGPVVTTGNTTASPTKQRPSINGLWTKKILDMSSLPPCVPLTNLCPLVIDPHGVGTRSVWLLFHD